MMPRFRGGATFPEYHAAAVVEAVTMKRKLLTACAALLAATSLSSCYVYDDPLTWAAPRPGYGRSYYSPPAFYPTRSYGYSSYRSRSHCAPPPPVCRVGGFGYRGWR